MLGYCFLPCPKKGYRLLNRNQSAAPRPLCPLPRSGIQDSPFGRAFLYICLFLATALVGVGIGAMRTTSAEEVQLANSLCGIGLACMAVYLWRVTRTARGNFFLLALVSFLLTYTTHTLLAAGVLCGLVFVMSEGSVLLALLPKGKGTWIPLLPILAYALTALLTQDLVGAAAVLIPYPPMVVLAVGTRRSAESEEGPTRVGVICGASLALGLTMGGMFLLSAVRHVGSTDPVVLLETAREDLMNYLLSVEIPTELPPESVEVLKELYTYENVKTVVDSTFNLLPALFTVGVMAIVVICQSMQFAAFRVYGMRESLTERVREFRMSFISCLVFLAAYMVVFLNNNVIISMSTIVAQNVYIILLPGLAISGTVRFWRAFTKTGRRTMGCLFYLIIFIPFLLVRYPIIPAAVEVISRIFTAVMEKLNPKDGEDNLFGGSKKDK